MKAALFGRPGLENLKVTEVPTPEIRKDEVLVKVVMAGVNPVDSFAVSGSRPVAPLPHIPGAEFAGVIEHVGSGVSNIQKGDRVTIFPRMFDGTCDLCLIHKEMLCRNGGIIGVRSNGGFAEYVAVNARNVFKIDDRMDWELAASIPVSALTAYHALKSASLNMGDLVVVVGASGNTGMFALQFANRIVGSRVVGVSRKKWVEGFGASIVVEMDQAFEKIKDITNGKMADAVIDSLGTKTFEKSFDLLGVQGKLISFGALTGDDIRLSVSKLYNKHLTVIGTTGGTMQEMSDIIRDAFQLKVKVWKKYKLEDIQLAVKDIFSPERDGRILIDMK